MSGPVCPQCGSALVQSGGTSASCPVCAATGGTGGAGTSSQPGNASGSGLLDMLDQLEQSAATSPSSPPPAGPVPTNPVGPFAVPGSPGSGQAWPAAGGAVGGSAASSGQPLWLWAAVGLAALSLVGMVAGMVVLSLKDSPQANRSVAKATPDESEQPSSPDSQTPSESPASSAESKQPAASAPSPTGASAQGTNAGKQTLPSGTTAPGLSAGPVPGGRSAPMGVPSQVPSVPGQPPSPSPAGPNSGQSAPPGGSAIPGVPNPGSIPSSDVPGEPGNIPGAPGSLPVPGTSPGAGPFPPEMVPGAGGPGAGSGRAKLRQGDFASRNRKIRRKVLRESGGDERTEQAVQDALQWLAENQRRNGSWTLNRGRNAGERKKADNAATGLALMAFLGAGHTPRSGKYSKNVRRGLHFLLKKMDRKTGSLRDPGGNMYSHGICATALCEIYGMTKDRGLRAPAQAAINYIVYAQDPQGGGWRYGPRQPGDTSVVGWQLMALKSAKLAGLHVPEQTIQKAVAFLDSVQTEQGAYYGYLAEKNQRKPATTAVGLLCRFYTGWDPHAPPFAKGVQYLLQVQSGQLREPYFFYYAAQVMYQYGGKEWDTWNEKMKNFLLETQEKEGYQKGSWYFDSWTGKQGGRLYCTAMACMTLQVYYRYSPMARYHGGEENSP